MRLGFTFHLLPFLLVLLTGCGTARPTQYAQGIPTAPPAPTFNPAWDAPHTVGQPGYVGPVENIPRSPHTRTLPETPTTRKEAGLWSGESEGDTRAALSTPKDSDPRVLGVPLPILEGKRGPYMAPVRECADELMGHIMGHPKFTDLTSLSPAQLRCFVARVHETCLKKKMQDAEIPVHPSQILANADRRAHVGYSLSAAFQFRKAACRGVRLPSAPTAIHDWLKLNWGIADAD